MVLFARYASLLIIGKILILNRLHPCSSWQLPSRPPCLSVLFLQLWGTVLGPSDEPENPAYFTVQTRAAKGCDRDKEIITRK